MEYGRLILERAKSPIQRPATKLGGLPVWVEGPAWPASPATGELMLFIGQIVIEPPLFPVQPSRIAYIFMTDSERVDLGTWDPRSGENAVIIQQYSSNSKPTIIEGPRLMEIYSENTVALRRRLEMEATVSIEAVVSEVPMEEIWTWEDDRRNEYYAAQNQRIGGVPDWIQGDETPEGWRLLLQLGNYPRVNGQSLDTTWNFGTGRCYVFISPDYSEGIVLWQC